MTYDKLRAIYDTSFFELISLSRAAFLENWTGDEVQLCTLLSIKTGGCSEDCSYCAQSARYSTGVQAERLMSTEAVMEVAQRAKENGSTRFCMGAAWKGVRDGDPRFTQVLETIREVSKLGMEVCVTLGQLSLPEAQKLKDAGVTAYNHNIDTSPEYYPEIVTTHTFQDRLNTIQAVQQAGMDVCCGGIIGMGETIDDRLRMLEVLTNFDRPGGFIELINPSDRDVDLGGFTVSTSDPTYFVTLPPGFIIPAHGYLTVNEQNIPRGIGASDAVRLFSRFDVLLDQFSWVGHPQLDFSRCPELNGPFLVTVPTRRAANDCENAHPPI